MSKTARRGSVEGAAGVKGWGDRFRAASGLRHPFDREILRLAIPALGALAADPLVSLIDTIFVGRLGVVPLAALGVNVSIFGFVFLVFNFLAYGTTPMVARAVGSETRPVPAVSRSRR